jgi:hypothetical protein
MTYVEANSAVDDSMRMFVVAVPVDQRRQVLLMMVCQSG